MSYEIIKLDNDLWTIQEGSVRMYLMDGKDGRILVDTGFGTGNLKELIDALGVGDVAVVNTHSHGDHTSGNKQFEVFYMHEKDRAEIAPMCPEGAVIRSVKEGDQITAGNITLEVIEIPGHTPGSIALLDRANRRLFSSDSIARNFQIYMQFPGQDLKQYYRSLQKLKSLEGLYDHIYPCHGDLHIEKSDLDAVISCVEGIMDGSLSPVSVMIGEEKETAYRKGDILILFNGAMAV